MIASVPRIVSGTLAAELRDPHKDGVRGCSLRPEQPSKKASAVRRAALRLRGTLLVVLIVARRQGEARSRVRRVLLDIMGLGVVVRLERREVVMENVLQRRGNVRKESIGMFVAGTATQHRFIQHAQKNADVTERWHKFWVVCRRGVGAWMENKDGIHEHTQHRH